MENQDLMKALSNCVPIASNKYVGNVDTNDLRTGIGDEQWSHECYQRYKGQFLQDALHGKGKYLWTFNNKQTVYEGQFYANDLEGYGRFSFSDSSIFEGLFKQGRRFGPGVLTYPDGKQDVGLWMGKDLMRLCVVVEPKWVPRIAKTPTAKTKMLKFKQLVSVCDTSRDRAKDKLEELDVNIDIIQQSEKLYNVHIRNPNSHFFNTSLFDNSYFNMKDCYIEVALTQEEEIVYYQEKSLQKIISEENSKEDSSNTVILNTNDECICDSPKQLRMREIESELEHTEAILLKMAGEIERAKYIKQMSKRRLVPKDEVRKSVGWEKIEVIGGSSSTIVRSAYEELSQKGSVFDNEDQISICEEYELEDDEIVDFETASKMLTAAENANTLVLLKKEHLLINLLYETTTSDNVDVEVYQRPTKKILITDLLAWNNEETSTEMLKHVFLHRNYEKEISYCVADLVTGDRSQFRNAGAYEEDCISFLKSCSNGNVKTAMELFWKHDLNPDLCDAKGNTAMIFAAARDRTKMIQTLVNLGANVDVLNDECFTPLGMCVARYLAVQNDVIDWEAAFLTSTTLTSEREQELRQWRPHASLISINKICHYNVEKSSQSLTLNRLSRQASHIRLEVLSEIFGSNLDMLHNEILDSLGDIQSRFGKLRTSHDFQEPYLRHGSIDKPQPYLLNTDCVKPPPEKTDNEEKARKGKKGKQSKKDQIKKGKKSKKSETSSKKSDKSSKMSKNSPDASTTKVSMEMFDPKPEETSRNNKLDAIYDTITTLLKYGANTNLCEVPVPTLILAIFTKNATLVEDLLSFKADPNVTTRDFMLTPLHVLVSLPPCEKLVGILKLFLNYSADANARTSPHHWAEEKRELFGEYIPTEGDEGKTPLHLLSMRYDYSLDPNEYMNQMAMILIEHGGKVKSTYLGHTPLSLAIMRKNVKLIKMLLDTKRINPNQLLGENMGVPLTIFILKRFKDMLSDINTCQNIIQLLLEYKANPFNNIEHFGNVIEFMIKEHEPPPKLQDDNKGKGKKKGQGKSAATGSKKTDKKGKKKKDDQKGNIQELLKRALTSAAKTVLEKHLKGYIAKYLYFFVEEEDYYDDISANMAKCLTPQETVKLLQTLFHRGEIPIDSENNYNVAYDLIEFIINIQNPWEDDDTPASCFVDIDEILKNVEFKRIANERGKLNLPEPEAEKHSDKYNVCFQCYQKKSRQLFICPECRVIYFCSQQCNALNNKDKTSMHKCGTLFYNEEKQIHDERLERGAHWRRTSEIRKKLPEIIQQEGWILEPFADDIVIGQKSIKADPRRRLHLSRQARSISTAFGRKGILSEIHRASEEFPTAEKKKLSVHKDASVLSLRWRREGSEFLHWKKKSSVERSGKKGKRDRSKSKNKRYSDEDYDDEGKRGRSKSKNKRYSDEDYDRKGRKYRSESEERRYDKQGSRSRKRLSDTDADDDGGRKHGKSGGGDKSRRSRRESEGSSISGDDLRGGKKGSKGRDRSTKHGGEREHGEKQTGANKKGAQGRDGINKAGKGEGRAGGGKLEGAGGIGKGERRTGGDIGEARTGGGKGDERGGINKEGYYGESGKSGKYGGGTTLGDKRISNRDDQLAGKMGRASGQGVNGDGSLNLGAGGEEDGFLPMPKGGRILDLQRRLPSKYQYFLEKISDYWPDFDFSMIFLPYACYSDGQLYYRFLSQRPVFMETYSNN